MSDASDFDKNMSEMKKLLASIEAEQKSTLRVNIGNLIALRSLERVCGSLFGQLAHTPHTSIQEQNQALEDLLSSMEKEFLELCNSMDKYKNRETDLAVQRSLENMRRAAEHSLRLGQIKKGV